MIIEQKVLIIESLRNANLLVELLFNEKQKILWSYCNSLLEIPQNLQGLFFDFISN